MSDITFDASTALVVVDVQNDFADPAGNLYVKDGAQVVPLINDAVARAKAAGAFVVYTADWHPEHTPHFAKDGGIWPDHCIGDTWGAEFHPDLVVDGPVVRKGVDGKDGYSGFSVRDPQSGDVSKTELGRLLREAGIERLVVCGLATDYCVKATALDGIEEGFSTILWKAAARSVDLQPGDGDRALREVAAAGGTLV